MAWNRRSEIQIGWTAFGLVRTAEGSPATTTRGVGDVTLAYKRSLLNPDGHQFSVALQPFVTMPVGRAPIGAGTLGVGLLVPVSKDLMRGLQLQVTLEVNAAPDADRAGRHLAYGSVIGLDVDLGGSVAATIEFSAFRDEAAGEHASALLGALAFAWQPTENLQIDAGGGVGLNRASADLRLYVGLAKRF
jgi:hypothetical protein